MDKYDTFFDEKTGITHYIFETPKQSEINFQGFRPGEMQVIAANTGVGKSKIIDFLKEKQKRRK